MKFTVRFLNVAGGFVEAPHNPSLILCKQGIEGHCASCKDLTHWTDESWGPAVYMCSDECSEKMWDEYNEAQRPILIHYLPEASNRTFCGMDANRSWTMNREYVTCLACQSPVTYEACCIDFEKQTGGYRGDCPISIHTTYRRNEDGTLTVTAQWEE